MTDNTNLEYWNKLSKTDPKHTKAFSRAGGFKGTAVKPIYTSQKMTEVFGPAGQGWGMGEPKFQVVPGHNGEVMVYCHVGVWWGNREQFVYGVGGDKIVTHIKANEQYNRPERWESDDEAFKKAFTDAVGNALKYFGMSADVHMGLFDDSKYVNELREEFAGEPAQIEGPRQRVKDSREAEKLMRQEVDACATVEDLKMLWRSKPFQAEFAKLHKTYQDGIVELIDERTKFLTANPANLPRVAPDFSRLESTN